MTDARRARLRGVIAFPITPFRDDLSLDLLGLRTNIQGLIEYALSAIVAAGGTGEMYSLTPSEHDEVVEVSIMKEMMNQLGMAAGPVRPPLLQVTAEDKRLVRQMLENWSPVLSSGVVNPKFPQPAFSK